MSAVIRAALLGATGLAALGLGSGLAASMSAPGVPWAAALLAVWPLVLASGSEEPASGERGPPSARAWLRTAAVLLGAGVGVAGLLAATRGNGLGSGPVTNLYVQVGESLVRGEQAAPWAVLAVLGIAGAAPLAFVRVSARTLEAQAGAGALGGALLGLPLAFSQGVPESLPRTSIGWFALVGASIGLVAWSAERVLAPQRVEASRLPLSGATRAVLCLLLAGTTGAIGAGGGALLGSPVGPVAPAQALVAIHEAQERYRAERGRYAASLGELAASTGSEPWPEWGSGAVDEHALRFACSLAGDRWAAAADGVADDAKSLMLGPTVFFRVDASGRVERRLEAPYPLDLD